MLQDGQSPTGRSLHSLQDGGAYRTLIAFATGRSKTYRTLIAFATGRCAALAIG